MRGISRDEGQASLETIALTAVVTVLVTAAAAYGAKPDLTGSVTRQFKRGLCIVRAGDCDRDRAPCVTASRDNTSRAHVTVAFVRLDDESGFLIEELSDGLVRLTYVHGEGIGLEAGLGANLEFDFGKVAFGVGGELRAAVMASSRAGGSVVLPSRTAAEQLKKWLTDPFELVRHPPRNWILHPKKILEGEFPSDSVDGPHLATVYGEANLSGTLGAVASVDPVGQGTVTLRSEDALGVRRDLKTGRRTFYYRRGHGYDAALGVGPDGMRQVAGLGARESTVYGIEFDRDGKPVDFSVSTLSPLRGIDDLPEQLRGSASTLLVGAGQRVLATERHLDLTQPGNLEAVKKFMLYIGAERGAFGVLAPVVRELEGKLDENATYDARSYAVSSSRKGGGGDFAAGAKIGVHAEEQTSTSKLLAALSRGDTGWAASPFCRAT